MNLCVFLLMLHICVAYELRLVFLGKAVAVSLHFVNYFLPVDAHAFGFDTRNTGR